MSDLTDALEAYRRLDPAGWVALYRLLPMGVGLALAGLGGFLMMFGGGRAFRLLAAPLGGALGFLLAPVLAARLRLGLSPQHLAVGTTAALGVLGLLVPSAALFVGVGAPLGILAGHLAGPEDWPLGFVPAFLVGGVVAVLLERQVAAIVSAAVGAWALVIGLLAALHQMKGFSHALAANPWGVLAAAGFFALAGMVFQLTRPSPEELAQLRVQRFQARKRAAEQRALERRWTRYTTNRSE